MKYRILAKVTSGYGFYSFVLNGVFQYQLRLEFQERRQANPSRQMNSRAQLLQS